MKPISEANYSGGVAPVNPPVEAQRGGFGTKILGAVGIDVKPKPPVPDAFQNAFNNSPKDALDPTVSPSTPIETTVSSQVPSANITSEVPSTNTSFLDPAPTASLENSVANPVSNPTNPDLSTSSIENTPRPLDTLTPPTQNIVAEEPRITTSNIDQPVQDTVVQPPEVIATPLTPEPVPAPGPQIVNTVTSPEPVVSSVPESTINNVSSEKSKESHKPDLQNFLLEHDLSGYTNTDGTINEEKLVTDSENPAVIGKYDKRAATLMQALKDRGLSLRDNELLLDGFMEVILEDQKKAA